MDGWGNTPAVVSTELVVALIVSEGSTTPGAVIDFTSMSGKFAWTEVAPLVTRPVDGYRPVSELE